jgi:acyl dehydratase
MRFTTISELEAAVGERVGVGPWISIDQERVTAFADVTEDHQWIHLDAERAANSPFKGTIAHGYLTLSLLPALARDALAVELGGPMINYGLNRVRFPAVVATGSRVRAHATIVDVEKRADGYLLTASYELEVEGQSRPGCVAETLTLLLGP